MTDILIRGMEMPKNCMVCDFRNRGFNLNGDLFCNCRLTKENVPDYCNIRMDDCPLVELPEHGDLIDRDAFRQAMYHEAFEKDSDMQKWDSGCWIRYKLFENCIESVPSVIPASERSEDE